MRSEVTISAAEARQFMVGHHGLRAVTLPPGPDGVRALLAERRHIQLDPLDKIGTNADLVAIARVDGVRRGDVHRHLYPGHAFEHFAKERCILPAYAFPYYRDRSNETGWWWLDKRLKRLPDGVVERVLDEVRARGPVSAADLSDHGAVERIDWSGWKGTGKAATMALEVLWTRCHVVTAGRLANGARLYDVPERALSSVAAAAPAEDFDTWAVLERVEAAGLLSSASGPHWSMLDPQRRAGVAERLVDEGRLTLVRLEGSTRKWYAPVGFLDRVYPEDDGRMRILGPLDPLIWDRKLTALAFGFDYVWEVYKPAAQRKWGWYVCPLLHGGELVGRVEAHVDAGEVVVDRLWKEDPKRFDDRAFAAAIARHSAGM